MFLAPHEQEGDRLKAPDYITGSVEFRHVRSVYKLSFLDIKRVNRFKPDGGGQTAEPETSDNDSAESVSDERGPKKDETVRLHVFLTKKRPKQRMADLEETGLLLRLDAGTEGCICSGKSFGDFDQVRVDPGPSTGWVITCTPVHRYSE